MQMLLVISLSILWGVMVVNLTLTVRLLRWVRDTNEARQAQQKRVAGEHHVVDIGAPAPEFKARTLAGQPVRLDDYAGRSVAFLFISPACGHCRMELPTFIKLAPLAKKNAGVDIILVSDWGPVVTQQWLDTVRREDGVDVPLPMLVAPPGKSDFLDGYNPESLTPSFCLLDVQSTVQMAGRIPSPEWRTLKRTWEGVTKLSPFLLDHYR